MTNVVMTTSYRLLHVGHDNFVLIAAGMDAMQRLYVGEPIRRKKKRQLGLGEDGRGSTDTIAGHFVFIVYADASFLGPII